VKINFASFKSALIMIAIFSTILTTGVPAFSAEQVKERKTITVQGSSSVHSGTYYRVCKYRGNDVQQKCSDSTERKCHKDGQGVQNPGFAGDKERQDKNS